MPPDVLPAQAGIVIAGGGVIGLATALELLKRSRDVLIVERSRPGAGTSTVAAGLLAPTAEADLAEPRLIDFALDSLRRYPTFVAEIEKISGHCCELRDQGSLWPAFTPRDEARLDELAAQHRQRGIASVRLTAEELRAREPQLAAEARSGLHVKDDLRIDPRRLVQSLTEAVQRRGGKISSGYSVREVILEGGTVQAVGTIDDAGQRHTVHCEVAVLAAGAWATTSVHSPLTAARVRPVKGQIVRLRGAALIQHALRTPGIYLVPRDDGELIIGGTIEERGFDQAPTAGAVAGLLDRASAVVPAIGALTISELSVGLRPALPDYLPAVGPTGADGFYAAVGHFRSGILLAPATAHYLAEAIVSGAVPSELAPLSPDRLAEVSASAPLPGAGPEAAR